MARVGQARQWTASTSSDLVVLDCQLFEWCGFVLKLPTPRTIHFGCGLHAGVLVTTCDDLSLVSNVAAVPSGESERLHVASGMVDLASKDLFGGLGAV